MASTRGTNGKGTPLILALSENSAAFETPPSKPAPALPPLPPTTPPPGRSKNLTYFAILSNIQPLGKGFTYSVSLSSLHRLRQTLTYSVSLSCLHPLPY